MVQARKKSFHFVVVLRLRRASYYSMAAESVVIWDEVFVDERKNKIGSDHEKNLDIIHNLEPTLILTFLSSVKM